MKLSFMKDQILDGLQTVQAVVGSRITVPILANVLLKAENGRLTMTTTDLQIGLRCGIEAEIEEEGAITLPAKRLFGIIRELPSGRIDMRIDEKFAAHISCGPSYFKVIGMPVEDFPAVAVPEAPFSFTIEQIGFKELLQRTHYAASTDETRMILNGVLLSFKDGRVTAVGTDGRRLALAEHEIDFPEEAAADVVVPMKTVGVLMHTLDGAEKMRLRLAAKQAAFEYGSITLVTNLVEGTYPNYRQVVPSQCKHHIAVERELLLDALKRVSLLHTDRSMSVRLTFEDNALIVRAVTPEVGEARDSLTIKYAGEKLDIAFNPEYLMDPLRNLNTDEVTLELIDEISPGVVKAAVPFIYVLMPVRIQENWPEEGS